MRGNAVRIWRRGIGSRRSHTQSTAVSEQITEIGHAERVSSTGSFAGLFIRSHGLFIGHSMLISSRRSPIASLVSCAQPSARRSFVVFGAPVVLPTSSPSAVALRWQLRPRIDRCDGRAHPDEGLDDKRKPQNAAACKLRRTGRSNRQPTAPLTSRCRFDLGERYCRPLLTSRR